VFASPYTRIVSLGMHSIMYRNIAFLLSTQETGIRSIESRAGIMYVRILNCAVGLMDCVVSHGPIKDVA
jgi:hypothetical protein